MNIKLLIGKVIDQIFNNVIELNYKLVPFIPNGRILPLDLKRAGITPKIIFDIGANIGQTANFFTKHFPASNIFCFEPVSSVYTELVSNTANLQIKCFKKALGSSKAHTEIYISDTYSGISSINGKDDENFNRQEIIEIDTGNDICNEYHISCIDLLKIDTEGYELEVLKGFEPMLKDRIKLIYVEVGFDPNDLCKTYISDLLEYLSPYGFISSGFYNPYRLGRNKFKLNHQDLLLINTTLIDV